MKINDIVVEVARSLTNLMEKPGNSGFYGFPQPYLNLVKSHGLSIASSEEVFKTIGWKKGQAWCDYLAELVWKTSYSIYDSSMVSVIDRLFTGSAMGTLAKFKREGWEFSNTPQKGALCFWKKKGHAWHGHIGIATEVTTPDYDEFKAVEGNTSLAGEREGKITLEKNNTIYGRDSLEFKGFILLKDI
jgi:hypothetical protein